MGSEIKSPLRYPGGKTRAIKFLKAFVPEYKEWREPFFGGGSFSIYAMQQQPDCMFKASDLNYELYSFWNELKKNPTVLIARIQAIYDEYKIGEKVGRALYDALVNRRNDLESELDRAVDFFILNRITFSGVVDAGGYSKASYERRFTQSSIERLKRIAPLLSKMKFYYKDYAFLTNQKGESVFIFYDPPYYSVTQSKLYGKKGILHLSFDHEQFAACLAKCRHKWLITYDDCEFIRDLYKDYHQKEWTLQYGMNNYKQGKAEKGRELLIANYDLDLMAKMRG